MSVTDALRVRSLPAVEGSTIVVDGLQRGARLEILSDPVAGSGYWWYRVSVAPRTPAGAEIVGWVAAADRDGTPWIGPAPEASDDLPFGDEGISVETLEELERQMVATWGGCVDTPWMAPYWVTVTFRSDGTYSATTLPGASHPAMYYGTDADSPLKRYELNDLQDDREGIGQIDIWFGDTVNRGELRNIRMMPTQLQFEFFHRGDYGPLTYRLIRLGLTS